MPAAPTMSSSDLDIGLSASDLNVALSTRTSTRIENAGHPSAQGAPQLSHSQPAQNQHQHGCSRLSPHILVRLRHVTQGQACKLGRHWCTWAIALHRGAHQPTVLRIAIGHIGRSPVIERGKSQLLAKPSLCHGDWRSTVLGRPQHRRPRGPIGKTPGGGRRRGALGASLGRERLCTAPQAPDDGPQRCKALPSPTKRALRRGGGVGAPAPLQPRGRCALLERRDQLIPCDRLLHGELRRLQCDTRDSRRSWLWRSRVFLAQALVG